MLMEEYIILLYPCLFSNLLCFVQTLKNSDTPTHLWLEAAKAAAQGREEQEEFEDTR